MNKAGGIKKINEHSLFLFINGAFLCFTLIFPKFAPVFIVALLLFGLYQRFQYGKPAEKGFPLIYSFSVVYFLLNVLGLLYTTDLHNGFAKTETKLAFVIFPIAFYFLQDRYRSQASRLIHLFLILCLVSVVFLFAQATFHYFREFYLVSTKVLYDRYTNTNFFFTNLLSPYVHPGYISVYYCFAIWLLLAGHGKNLGRYWRWTIMAALLVSIYFLASKAGLIICALVLMAWMIRYLKKKFRSAAVFYFAVALCVIALLAMASVSEIVRTKFETMYHSVVSSGVNVNSNESNDVRKAVWKASYEVGMRSPLVGYGTGDVQNELDAFYSKNHYVVCLDHHYNSHNQFLQSFVAIGLMGLLALILLFIWPMIKWRKNGSLTAVFSGMFLVSALVESIFETQTGVVFFTYFYCLLPLLNRQEKNSTAE